MLTNVLGRGIMRGMAKLAQSAEVPCLIEQEEIARSSGVPVGLILKAVAEGSMFCVVRDGHALYPSFFADAKIDQHGVKAVCRKLGDLPGGSKWQFFTTPTASLGGITPIDALQRGLRENVLRAAQGFAER